MLIEIALKFKLKTINYHEEYKILIANMILALKMGVSKLKVNNDS